MLLEEIVHAQNQLLDHTSRINNALQLPLVGDSQRHDWRLYRHR
jgi:hypothetical protein